MTLPKWLTSIVFTRPSLRSRGESIVVFANAGFGEFVPFGAITDEHFDKLFNINVKGNAVHGAKRHYRAY